MILNKYKSRFEELSKFSSYLTYTHDEAWKVVHFERGLGLEIIEKVTALKINNSTELANKCRIIEKDICILEVEMHKRKQIKEGHCQTSKNKIIRENSDPDKSNNQINLRYPQPTCSRCRKNP